MSNINIVLIDHSYVVIIIIIYSMYTDCYAYSESFDELWATVFPTTTNKVILAIAIPCCV